MSITFNGQALDDSVPQEDRKVPRQRRKHQGRIPIGASKMKDFIVVIPDVKFKDNGEVRVVPGLEVVQPASSASDAYTKVVSKFKAENSIPVNVTVLSSSITEVHYAIGATR